MVVGVGLEECGEILVIGKEGKILEMDGIWIWLGEPCHK